jgi:two-component system, OmpR family, sensor histidine kinase MtrB
LFLKRLLNRRRLGLRSRTTAAFTLGALLLSAMLAVTSYQLARRNAIDQRKRATVRQALFNAAQVRDGLLSSGLSPEELVQSLGIEPSRVLLRTAEGEVGVSDVVGADLLAVLDNGEQATQMVRRAGEPLFIVGATIDVSGTTDQYFEWSNLSDIEDNLSTLFRALLLASILTTLAGAAIGRAASGRVVRPLRAAAGAASEIASGRLDTRLEVTGDPDLDPLVASFNDMAASLQGRLEREARFASDVSHELRTPLTAMAAAAQLLSARRDELSERGQTALDVLTGQVEHFRRLVLDLLEISRFDAQAAELLHEPVDLVDLIAQVASAHSIEPTHIDSTGLVDRICDVDKRRVERVVTNLLQNAANYGGGAVEIRLAEGTLTGVNRSVRIEVADAGPGVPDDEKQRIFERFTRGTAQLTRTAPKGTGLGLSLVAEHVRLHGGRAWVEDRLPEDPASGARFVVMLAAPPDDFGGSAGGVPVGAAVASAPSDQANTATELATS